MKSFVCLLTMGVLLCWTGYAAEAKAAVPVAAPRTLENLMKAFDGESNAHARYLAFAQKADGEGYGQVASLFRAAAAAEKVHFTNHAEVIKKLGGTPKADIKAPDVKSTKENVEAAVKGETYEYETMYPEFIKVAESEKVSDAVEVLAEAKAAEQVHAGLYKEAAGNLDGWKSGKKDFNVCPECGNVVLLLNFEKCPICATPKAKFMKVS